MSGEGSLMINIPETYTVIAALLHSAAGDLVWKDQETTSVYKNIRGLKPGFYILTVELAQVMYRVPIGITE